MSDLREALERWAMGKFELDAALIDNDIQIDQSIFDALDAQEAAARRFLALTETGRRVNWCVTHRNIAWEDFEEKPFDEFLSRGFRCPAGSWIEGAGAWDCSIEPTLIIPADYLTEEER